FGAARTLTSFPTRRSSDLGTGTDEHWIAWVAAVATHNATYKYPNQIKYYEIWNEWDAKLFWVGTKQQLVRMEQDARCVVKGPPSDRKSTRLNSSHLVISYA